MQRWSWLVIGGLSVLTFGAGMLAVVEGDMAKTAVLSMTVIVALGLAFLSVESFIDSRLSADDLAPASVTAPNAALLAMGCTAAVVMLLLTVGLGSVDRSGDAPVVAGVQQVNPAAQQSGALPGTAELRVFGAPEDARMVVRIDGQPVAVATEAGLLEIPDVALDQRVEVSVLTGDSRSASCAVVLGDREDAAEAPDSATCILD